MAQRRYKFDPHPSQKMRQFSPPGGAKPGGHKAVKAGGVFTCEDTEANRAIVARINGKLLKHKEMPAILDLGLVEQPKPAGPAEPSAPESAPTPAANVAEVERPDDEQDTPAERKVYPPIPRLNGATADLAAYLKEHDGADVDAMERDEMIARLKEIRDLRDSEGDPAA